MMLKVCFEVKTELQKAKEFAESTSFISLPRQRMLILTVRQFYDQIFTLCESSSRLFGFNDLQTAGSRQRLGF